ncbi:MAG: DUF3137 domain-containing protein [Bacillota bacterium]|nr:DUF3137 domain-containing protein [Bacillota bacterium]
MNNQKPINLDKYRSIMIYSFAAVIVLIGIIISISLIYPELLQNSKNIFAVLILVILISAVAAFPIFMKKIKGFQLQSAVKYIDNIKLILGNNINYYYEGRIYLKDIYNDPSIYPLLSNASCSEHMIQGTYENINYIASNLKVFTNDYVDDRSRSYSFDGYYIIAWAKDLNINNINFKVHIRTYNYMKSSPTKTHTGSIKGKGVLYQVIESSDEKFNKYFIVTSDSKFQAEQLLRNDSFRNSLTEYAKMTNREFAIFFHGDGRISIAVPDFITFDFGFTHIDEKEIIGTIEKDTVEIRDLIKVLENVYRTVT